MSLDQTILYWIQNHTVCDLLDLLMPKLTLLGSGGAIWLLAAGGMLCTKKYRRQGVILLAGLAVGVLVGNVCLKNLIARPRPCWLDDSVMMLISSPTDYSFPSGHTLSSVIGATVLTKTDRRFGWAAIPLAAVIAFSRLYLFVALGGAIGSVSRFLLGKLPVKAAGFPVITLGINVVGAFCIGLIVAAVGKHSGWDPRLVLFLKVGFCGGFTTFSTFSLETA